MKTSTKTGTMFSSRPIGRAGFAILAMAIVFGMAAGFTACNNDTPDKPDNGPKNTTNPFLGTWTGEDSDGDQMTMTFTANTYEMKWPELEGEDTKGTYTYKGNKAALKDQDRSEGVAGVSEGVTGVSEDTLVFNFSGWPLTGTLTRPSSSKPSEPPPSVPEAKATLRYEIVPAGRVPLGRTLSEDALYALVTSVKDKEDKNDYYLYHLGQVNKTPILYKDAFRYEGMGVQTIYFEKSWSNEDAVMQSMTTAKENTFEHNWSVGLSFEYAHKFGAVGVLESQVKLGIQASYGQTIGETISTSNTSETSRAKVEGETQGLSVILDPTDPQGTYRYVLFGTIDVYCFFTVDPTTRAVIGKPVITQCAREASYYWALDYEPLSSNGVYGRTVPGSLFDDPAIDFSKVPRPTEILGEGEQPDVVPGLAIKWYEERKNSRRIKDSESWREYYTISPAFDITRLTEAGYNHFNFKLSFDAYEVDNGWVNINVDDNKGFSWWNAWESIDLTKGRWNTIERQFDLRIDKMTPQFSISWDASGAGADDYDLGDRRITIEARKQ
jgi:hypothetical protein